MDSAGFKWMLVGFITFSWIFVDVFRFSSTCKKCMKLHENYLEIHIFLAAADVGIKKITARQYSSLTDVQFFNDANLLLCDHTISSMQQQLQEK